MLILFFRRDFAGTGETCGDTLRMYPAIFLLWRYLVAARRQQSADSRAGKTRENNRTYSISSLRLLVSVYRTNCFCPLYALS